MRGLSWSRPLSLTPGPGGHCLPPSPEPLSGDSDPFLTPVLRLGGVVPEGGDSVWGCQQTALCPRQPWHGGSLGEPRPRGPGQETVTEISSCFISCSRGSPLPFSPVTTDDEEQQLPPKLSRKYVPLQPCTTLLAPALPPSLVPTPCQLGQQCQAGTGVTKPVGVCLGGGDPEATPQSSRPPPHTRIPRGAESPSWFNPSPLSPAPPAPRSCLPSQE